MSESTTQLHQPIVFSARKPRTDKRGVFLTLLFVGILLTLGIVPRVIQGHKLASFKRQMTVVPVSVAVMSPRVLPPNEELALPGSVQAFREATIYARSAGYLHQRFVDIGSRVKQGQLLATIESPEVDEEVNVSQANVEKEMAAGQQAYADVYRLQAALVSSQAQVSQARAVLQEAIADVAHSSAKLIDAQGAESAARAKLLQVQRRLDGVRASLAQYQTKEQLADKTYRRWKELAAGGAVSGQDLDESEAAYETSLSAVTEAQASVESVRADVVSAMADVQSRGGDVTAAEADIRAARQRVAAAQSALDASQSNVAAAKASIQAGKANVQAAKASIGSSEASLSRAGVLRSFEQVTAPFDGVITARNVDVGSLIGAGSGSTEGFADPQSTVPRAGMFGLAKTDVLRVQVNVPENYVPDIHVGDVAEVTSPQVAGLEATGRVFDQAGALDAKTRTLLVEVRVPNPDGKLVPGMYAQVHFNIHHEELRLRVASDVLIIDAKGVRVAEVTPDSTIHFQPVQLGRDFGKEVEVVSGVTSENRLVENPADDLVEGQKVTVSPGNKS